MPAGQLSELAEGILLSLWKMNAVGEHAVDEKAVLSDVNVGVNDFVNETTVLEVEGFITKFKEGSRLSLTPLGLAILRQVEEDKLQELK